MKFERVFNQNLKNNPRLANPTKSRLFLFFGDKNIKTNRVLADIFFLNEIKPNFFLRFETAKHCMHAIIMF